MELVWHNCKECPPEETANDNLIATNGVNVYDAAWYAPDGFMFRYKSYGIGDEWWDSIYGEELKEWYWADIKQTVQNEPRFNA